MEANIKRLTYLNAFLFLLLLGLACFFMLRPYKSAIVYVNSNKLLVEYAGMQAVKEEYVHTTTPWRQQVDTLQQELQYEFEKYEQEQKYLTGHELQQRRQMLENKREQFVKFQAAIQDKMKTEEQRLQGTVLEDVNKFLKQYGEEHGYEMIMAATTVGNIVYAAEGKDITEDVLKELNEQYNQVN